jgi:hypothetical protein
MNSVNAELSRDEFCKRRIIARQGEAANITGAWLWLDIVIVGGSITLALVLGATTLRRRTA